MIELSSLRSLTSSTGSLDPLALRNPAPARITPLSPLKGAYPLQTFPDISGFLRNSEMFMYSSFYPDGIGLDCLKSSPISADLPCTEVR